MCWFGSNYIIYNIYLTGVQIIDLQIKMYDIIDIYIDMWKCENVKLDK